MSDQKPGNKQDRRLQFNPNEIRIVSRDRRQFWDDLRHEVQITIPGGFRKKWTNADTARVILASPDETYEAVANELNRSPGAIRYRRQAMIHLLRDEHGAHERVEAYRDDPATNHKFADYAQVHDVLEGLGYFTMPVSEQFALAVPLSQPNGSWRGDGISSVLSQQRQRRDELRELLQENRAPRDGRTDSAPSN